MSTVKFRGISGVIRRAINNGVLVGRIEPHIVRSLLPEAKKAAPNEVIISSLKHLTNLNEIQEKGGEFFTKTPESPDVSLQRVLVIGKLVRTAVNGGKCIVTLEVEQMEDAD